MPKYCEEPGQETNIAIGAIIFILFVLVLWNVSDCERRQGKTVTCVDTQEICEENPNKESDLYEPNGP